MAPRVSFHEDFVARAGAATHRAGRDAPGRPRPFTSAPFPSATLAPVAAGKGDDVVYAIVKAGRTDRASILMIVDDETEAQEIAFELRRRSVRVEVLVLPRRFAEGQQD